jgi:hypothetical protein
MAISRLPTNSLENLFLVVCLQLMAVAQVAAKPLIYVNFWPERGL